MVPGTDRVEDENLVYRARTEDGFPCIATRFLRVVPTPRADAKPADILEFKKTAEAIHRA
jgi:hypothetical protein